MDALTDERSVAPEQPERDEADPDAWIDGWLASQHDPALDAELDARYAPVSSEPSEYDRERMAELAAVEEFEDEFGGPFPHDPELDELNERIGSEVGALHESGAAQLMSQAAVFRLARLRGAARRCVAPAKIAPRHEATPRAPRARASRARRIRTAARRGPPRQGEDDSEPDSLARDGEPSWAARWWPKASELTLFGCVLWGGAKTRDGYGQFWVAGRLYLAHRIAYERAYGPIPEGLELHHLCGSRACVAPDHLIAVTRREHVRLTLETRRRT